MSGKELAELVMQYPDYEIEFVFTDGYSNFPNVRVFDRIEICDIGHCDKVVLLTGEEQ